MREFNVISSNESVVEVDRPHGYDPEENVELVDIGFFNVEEVQSPTKLRLGESRGKTRLSDLVSIRIGRTHAVNGEDVFLTDQEEAEHAARKIAHNTRPRGKTRQERIDELKSLSKDELQEKLIELLAGAE